MKERWKEEKKERKRGEEIEKKAKRKRRNENEKKKRNKAWEKKKLNLMDIILKHISIALLRMLASGFRAKTYSEISREQ